MGDSTRRPFPAVLTQPDVEQWVAWAGLPLAAENLPGVTESLTQLRAYADLLAEFPLDANQEAAPVFEP